MAQAQEVFLFNPTSIASCQLWLDAADPSNTGTQPAIGSAVSTWVDKSGNARNLTTTTAGTGSVTFTRYKNNPAILFNSASTNTAYMRVVSAVNLTNLTVFVICLSQTAITNQNSLLAVPASGFEYGSTDAFGHFIDAATPQDRFYANGQSFLVQNAAVSAGGDAYPLRISAFTCTSAGVLSSFLNGTAGQSTTGSARSGTATGFGIGFDIGMPAGSPVNLICVSQFSECIVYNTVLSTADRQQIEGYLAWKWGLQGSLPSTHPFKNYRTLANPPIPTLVPTMPIDVENVTVFDPLSIAGCLLWLDARDASTLTITSGTGTLATYVQASPTTSTVTTSSTPPSLFSLASGTCFMNGSFINGSAGRSGFLVPRSTNGDMFAFCYDLLTCKVVSLRFTLSGGVLSVTATGTGFGNTFLRITNSPTDNETIFATYTTTVPIATSDLASGYGVANFTLNFGTVSQWNDKSSNGWNVSNATNTTQPTYSAIGLNGLPALSFSANFLARTNTGTSSLANYTVFFAVNQNAVPAEVFNYFLDFLTGRLVYGYNTVAGQGVGLGLFNGSWTTFSQTRTGPLVISYICTNGGAIFVNGTSIGTITTFASIALNGAMAVGSHNNTAGFFYNGSIGEILIYNTAFTATQRQQVERYLAWKWNTTYLLDSTVPGSTAPLVPFDYQITPFIGRLNQWLPTQIPNTQLWLDASIPSLFTLSPGTTTVTAVSDRNTPAKTLSVVNTVTYNARTAINFTDTNGRFTVTGMPSSPFDYFFVGRALASTANYRTMLRSSAVPGTHHFLLEAGTNNAGMWSGSGFSQFGSYTMTANEQAMFYGSMAANNTIQASKNGTIALTASSAAGVDSIISIIGNAIGGQPFGELQELVVYSGTLTTSQRQQVEGYLAWKWGLVANLPANHPFKLFPPPP